MTFLGDTTIAVMYNGKKIIPVQTINIQKEYVRNETGALRKVQFQVSARGTLVAFKGSPDENGDFWTASGYPPDTDISLASDPDKRLAFLRNKMGALQNLFCEQGKLFEIQPYDGSAPIKFVPRVKDITFSEGVWFDRVDYVINMETDQIDFGTFILCTSEETTEDVDETWTVEPSDDKARTYKMSHTVASFSKDEYDPSGTGTLVRKGWVVARDDKVTPRLGFDSAIRNGSLAKTDLDGFIPYNYIKNENIDISGGKYSITENWILYDGGPYLEEYTVTTKTAADTGQSNVSVDGNITGFSSSAEPGNGNRYANAEVGWATIQPLLITRAQSYSGLTLNATVVNNTIGKNPNNGVITYNYEYTNKPTVTISGALDETVTVTDQFPTAVIAKHICVLRVIGPALQDIGTVTESRRSISIEVQMPVKTTSYTPTKPDVTSLITPHIPVATYEGPYVDRNEEVWIEKTGRYTRLVSWFWV